jgi:hypothetical protein
MGKLKLVQVHFSVCLLYRFHFLGSSWIFPSLLASCRDATFCGLLYEALVQGFHTTFPIFTVAGLLV